MAGPVAVLAVAPYHAAMLRIREAQMAVFQAARDDEFASWAASHVRRTCPSEASAIEDDELRRRAVVGLRRARRAGFTEPSLVADFLVLMVRHAPNFDDHPEVQRALHRDLPRELLLLTLPSAVSAAAWEEVRARRDERAWEG